MPTDSQTIDDYRAISVKMEELKRHFVGRGHALVVAVLRDDGLCVKTSLSVALSSISTDHQKLQDLVAGAFMEFLRSFPQIDVNTIVKVGGREPS
jgi:hypothetical protein